MLGQTGLDPRSLVLEITESELMEDARANAQTLRELKLLGVRITIDDFDTGYSSLACLKRFPVDFQKIDRSFVDGLGEDSDDEGSVSSVVNLAARRACAGRGRGRGDRETALRDRMKIR